MPAIRPRRSHPPTDSDVPSGHVRHRAATGCTASAFFCALSHHLVVAEGVTALGAGLAHFRAGAAGRLMVRRMACQKVGTRRANLRAVEHQRDVHGVCVLAALVQAMMHGMRARLMAGRTGVDAGLHAVCVSVNGCLGHCTSSRTRWRRAARSGTRHSCGSR